MAASLETRPDNTRKTRRSWLPSALFLAGQRARRTWGLLALTELGMLVAILLVCVVPLYANVTVTAALRNILNAQNSTIAVSTWSLRVSPPVVARATRELNAEMRHTLGPYLDPVRISLQVPALLLSAGSQVFPPASGADMNLVGEDMSQATGHFKLVAGSLPAPTTAIPEILVTPATERALHCGVGDLVKVNLNLTDAYGKSYPQVLSLRVSGLFTPGTPDDFFWQGNTFAPSNQQGTHFFALLPYETLLNTLTNISTAATPLSRVFASAPTMFWYYHLNPAHMAISDLSALSGGIQQVQFDNANNPDLVQDPYLIQTQTLVPSSDVFDSLNRRIAIFESPVISLALPLLGLLLFFLIVMMHLLVEGQGEAIAILRSRGAGRGQIMTALILQGGVLTVLALLGGLLLASPVVGLFAHQMLASNEQDALNILASGPWQTVNLVGPEALVTALVTLVAVVFAVWTATRGDILSLRRETARSTHRPLWQRLHLDLVAAVLALAGFLFATYLLRSPALDSGLYLLMIAPLTLLQTLFLLLTIFLILFRFYPRLLRLGVRLVGRRRSAPAVLALSQIARAPRQSARVTMLLALAGAFAIFALVLSASQAQRVWDVALYRSGADFSGTLPASQPLDTPQKIQQMTDLYRRVPGVLGVSLGLCTPAQSGGLLNTPIDFQAVDATTFARAATWSAQDSQQPLTALMQQLSSSRVMALRQKVVPAIVEKNTMNILHLKQNMVFNLQLPEISTRYFLKLRVVAEVEHLPAPGSGNSAQASILVDYPVFARIFSGDGALLSGKAIAPNYAWLHTGADAAALARVRAALTSGPLMLDPLRDRRAIESALVADPIYRTLLGELELGTGTTLALALVCCLIASWLSVRGRLNSFMALRALGATPRQIISTLAWEQGIIYTVALLVGMLIGALFAFFSLPAFVLTGVPPPQFTGTATSSTIQFVPPLQVILPGSLWLVLGLLVVICLLVLGLLIRKVSAAPLAVLLRLDED